MTKKVNLTGCSLIDECSSSLVQPVDIMVARSPINCLKALFNRPLLLYPFGKMRSGGELDSYIKVHNWSQERSGCERHFMMPCGIRIAA